MLPPIVRFLCLLAASTKRNSPQQQQQKQDVVTPLRIFIGGLGYTGSQIAADLHAAFPHAVISATVRSTARRSALLASPLPPWLAEDRIHVLDIDDTYTGLLSTKGLDDLLQADTIFQTIPPIADFDRDPLLALHGDLLLKQQQQSTTTRALKYVAYISSTGVYGNHDGRWVKEDDDLKCTDAKSLARIQAEKEWGELENKYSDDDSLSLRVDCFRCGGIYGPGRGPLFSSLESLTQALSSERIDSEDAPDETPIKYVNRILVNDISGAILTARSSSRPFCLGGRAYNLVDDDPAPRKAVVAEARRLLILETEGKDDRTNSPPSTTATKNIKRGTPGRGTGNKRCDNSRLKTEYGWTPTAPTFREGLRMLLQNNALKNE